MNKQISNQDGYVEVRNDSHAPVFVRIVKTELGGNTHIYIEDAPDVIPQYDPNAPLDVKTVREDRWEFIDSHDSSLLEVQMSEF